MLNNIKVIAFDADDTLWINEPYFRETEEAFSAMLADFLPQHSVERELLKIEIDNLPVLGYGVKAFIISMVETAIKISNGSINSADIEKIIILGKTQLDQPVILLDGILDVLESLNGKYRLVMATKGDLLEQQNKLRKSGLEKYFHHIEIVSEKTSSEYSKLIQHLDIAPSEFLMIGNSLKSDIIPVLDIGGHAFHIPYKITWTHERVEGKVDHPNFKHLDNTTDILKVLL